MCNIFWKCLTGTPVRMFGHIVNWQPPIAPYLFGLKINIISKKKNGKPIKHIQRILLWNILEMSQQVTSGSAPQFFESGSLEISCPPLYSHFSVMLWNKGHLLKEICCLGHWFKEKILKENKTQMEKESYFFPAICEGKIMLWNKVHFLGENWLLGN